MKQILTLCVHKKSNHRNLPETFLHKIKPARFILTELTDILHVQLHIVQIYSLSFAPTLKQILYTVNPPTLLTKLGHVNT